MPVPFWLTNIGQGIDCLLPDIAVQERLPDFWAWEVIYMNKRRVPGLVDVKFGREHRVDKRTANGQDNTAVTSLGYNGADVKIHIRIWTPQQWADFINITIPSVQPRPGKIDARPKAVPVEYPSLSAWGTKALFVTHVDGPHDTGIKQVKEIILTCSDVAPLVAVTSTTQKGGGLATVPNAIAGQPTPTPSPSQAINNPSTGQ